MLFPNTTTATWAGLTTTSRKSLWPPCVRRGHAAGGTTFSFRGLADSPWLPRRVLRRTRALIIRGKVIEVAVFTAISRWNTLRFRRLARGIRGDDHARAMLARKRRRPGGHGSGSEDPASSRRRHQD